MQRFIVILLLSFSVVQFGCSDRPAGMPRLYPFLITVTQDGVPLAEASVTLVNISDADVGNAWAPMGKTNSSGVAEIRTNAQYVGVPAGKYRVIVEKIEIEPSKMRPPPAADSPNYEEWAHQNANENRAQYILVETIFSSSETPHEIEVGQGVGEKSIDVGKAVRVKR